MAATSATVVPAPNCFTSLVGSRKYKLAGVGDVSAVLLIAIRNVVTTSDGAVLAYRLAASLFSAALLLYLGFYLARPEGFTEGKGGSSPTAGRRTT